MSWYRFGLCARWLRIPVAALLAEFIVHVLGFGWAFTVLAVVAGFMSVNAGTAMTKAAAAHQRIDVLVPHIAAIGTTAGNAMPKSGGTFTGTVTTQDHHVNGTLFGAGGTLTVGDNTHVSGSALTSDGTITGHSQINADGSLSGASIHTGGVGQFDSGVSIGGNTAISSSRAFAGASMHSTGDVQVDGDLRGMASVNGTGLPMGVVHHDGVSAAANGVVDRLNSIGFLPTP